MFLFLKLWEQNLDLILLFFPLQSCVEDVYRHLREEQMEEHHSCIPSSLTKSEHETWELRIWRISCDKRRTQVDENKRHSQQKFSSLSLFLSLSDMYSPKNKKFLEEKGILHDLFLRLRRRVFNVIPSIFFSKGTFIRGFCCPWLNRSAE